MFQRMNVSECYVSANVQRMESLEPHHQTTTIVTNSCGSSVVLQLLDSLEHSCVVFIPQVHQLIYDPNR